MSQKALTVLARAGLTLMVVLAVAGGLLLWGCGVHVGPSSHTGR